MSFLNPLNLFRPLDPAAASKRAEQLQQRGPGFTKQVAEMIGTFGTAFGRLFASVGSAPLAVGEGAANLVHKGIETFAYPFGYVGKIMNTTRTKLYGVLGQEWGPGWSGRVKTAVKGS